MCVSGFMHVHHIHEAAVRWTPQNGVTDLCELQMWMLGAQSRSSVRQASALIAEPCLWSSGNLLLLFN